MACCWIITLKARSRDSNGLSSEGELRIFDEAVKKDDEFTHDGDEG